jgi:hypothetical protein
MPSDKHVVAAADVAELLRKARAPVPPDDKLRELADAMTMMAARYLYAPAPPMARQPRTIWHKAQKALEKLRASIQVIIEYWEGCAAAFRQSGSAERAAECEAEAEECRRLLDALPDFLPPAPKGPLWADPKTGKRPTAFHLEAKLLLQLYRECVDGDAGVSRSGPAVRFIGLALKRCGVGKPTEGAIELALVSGD